VSARVYVHIGLPKTGTTFVQSALWEGREVLASVGCLVPGDQRVAKWRAASDLLGRRPKGAGAADISGAWDAFARDIREWHGDTVVFSEELLSTATRRQISQLTASVGGAEVHAVVTVRDLARVLPSLWQHEVRKGNTWTWPEFLDSVREPRHGSVNAAAAFWLRFDVQKVTEVWAGALAPERIHVVVVPPAGSPPGALLERFATAVRIDPAILAASAPEAQQNTALGYAEVEALRRLNVALGDTLNERQYTRAVVGAAIPALEARSPSTRISVPAAHREWLDALTARWGTHLRTSAYDVIGSLDDLRPASPPAVAIEESIDDAALAEPLVDALAAVCTTYANRWWKSRSEERPVPGEATDRSGSARRAATYRAKSVVLEKAEHNRALRWAALAYMRRRR
jgi:hypothetical protein